MTRTRALAAAALGLLALGAVARWRWPDSAPAPSVAGAPAPGTTVDLNTASEDELARLPGVGRSLARKLVEARQARGGFERWEDVDAVDGVGPARLDALRTVTHLGSSATR
ncbi:helix-hairpin-helix domain-containing protein [Myxococcaceae bacterium GXIMD 01537]